MSSRAGGALRRWLAALLVLVVLLGAAELVVRRQVEQRMAQAVAGRVGGEPRVGLPGTSALLGLATDHWPAITLTDQDAEVPLQGSTHRVDLDLRARDVSGLVGGGTVRVGNLDGSVRADWSTITQGTDVSLSGDDAGTLVARTTVPALGEQLPVVVTGHPALSTDREHLTITGASATLDGVEVPSEVVDGVLTRLAARTALPQPPGVAWTSVSVDSRGATVGLTGSRLQVHR